MEHQKLEEILSVNVLDLFFLEINKHEINKQVYLLMSLNKQLQPQIQVTDEYIRKTKSFK